MYYTGIELGGLSLQGFGPLGNGHWIGKSVQQLWVFFTFNLAGKFRLAESLSNFLYNCFDEDSGKLLSFRTSCCRLLSAQAGPSKKHTTYRLCYHGRGHRL